MAEEQSIVRMIEKQAPRPGESFDAIPNRLVLWGEEAVSQSTLFRVRHPARGSG